MAKKDVTLRGFGVLLPDWVPSNLDASDSSYTEAGPFPGSALASTTGARGVPQILGAQADDVVFKTSRASGLPAVGEFGGAYAWYLDDESDTDARHWLPPLRITGCQLLRLTSSTSRRDAVVCPLSGKVVVSSAIGTGSATTFDRYDPYTSEWEQIARPEQPATIAGLNVDEIALACVPGTDTILGVAPQGFTFRSEDYGDTWDLISWFDQKDSPTAAYTFHYARVAFDGRDAALMVGKRSNANTIDLFVSKDLGSTWQSAIAATITRKYYDIASHPSGSIVAVAINSSDDLIAQVLGSADESPNTASSLTLDSSNNYDQAAIGVDDDGMIWIVARRISGDNHFYAWYSADNGLTFVGPVSEVITTDGTAATDRISHPKLVFANGRGMLITGKTSGDDPHPCCLFLGGWEGPCFDLQIAGNSGGPGANYPSREFQYRLNFTGQHVSQRVWAAFIAPANYAIPTTWAHVTSGSGAIALSTPASSDTSGLHCSSSTLGATAYVEDVDTSADDNWYVEFGINPRTSGVTSAGIGVRLQGPGYDVGIDFDQNDMRVYDYDAAAQIGATVALPWLTADQHIDVRAYHDGAGELTILYRSTRVAGAAYATKFVKVTRTLTGGGARASQVTMRFGLGTNGGTGSGNARAVRFTYFQFLSNFSASTVSTAPVLCEGSAEGWGKSVGADHPYPLPEVYNTTTTRVARFRVRGGPLILGDTHDHDMAHEYPVEATFPTVEPSPQRRWRTAAKGVTQHLAVKAQSDGRLVPHLGLFSVVLAVRDANVRQVELYSKDSASAYNLLGTLDLATGFTSLSYTKGNVGSNVILPQTASGTSGARYIRAGELVGGHVIFDPAGTPKVRRIVTNTAGFWAQGALGSFQKPLITLEGMDGSEANTGTCHIVWPSGYMVVHQNVDPASLLSHYRLTIQSTELSPDSYYELGDAAVYGLVVPGKQWGHGFEDRLDPNLRIVEDDYGTQRRVQRGPNRRTQVLTWDHGALDARLDGQSSADYLGPTSQPLASDHDVRGQLDYLWQITQGGALPVLTLAALSETSGVTVTDPRLWLAGYLSGGNRHQEAAGRSGEGVDSFYRSGPVTVVERV